MMMMKKWLRTFMLCSFTLAIILSFAPVQKNAEAAATGFYVSGSSVKDANGNTFVMRGVNVPSIWYDSQSYTALTTIAGKKANAVRIVWNTNGSATRLQEIINRCKALKLVAIVELHDGTGSNNTTTLNAMASYYASSSIKSILINNAKYVIVNIANEWGDSSLSDTAWRDAYKTAITTIRNAGINNLLMIDGSGWGQYASPIKTYGKTLLNYDPNKNIMFSLHMYGNYNTASKIGVDLWDIQQLGLAVTVGEFGYNYNSGNNNLGCTVDAQTVMNEAQWKGVGYLAWSWTGNDSSNAWLDLSSSSDWTTLTSWGKLVFNGTNGIVATSSAATVY
jgi:mannan endo-1,4-beta-mannosidase